MSGTGRGLRVNSKSAPELNPNLAGAHGLSPFYLSAMGRHTEALAEAKLTQELDPLQEGSRFTFEVRP